MGPHKETVGEDLLWISENRMFEGGCLYREIISDKGLKQEYFIFTCKALDSNQNSLKPGLAALRT